MIGVVLCVAFGVYQTTAEKVKKVEAIIMLGALRGSETRYFAVKNTFADSLELLDFNPNEVMIGREAHFLYEIASADPAGFTAVATRSKADGGDGKGTVTIDEAGRFGGTMQ